MQDCYATELISDELDTMDTRHGEETLKDKEKMPINIFEKTDQK